jgi:hypothetical protein
MVVQTDYRTNRADYAIAAKSKVTPAAVAADTKKKAVRLDDQRSARLAANPSDTSDKLKPRPRG